MSPESSPNQFSVTSVFCRETHIISPSLAWRLMRGSNNIRQRSENRVPNTARKLRNMIKEDARYKSSSLRACKRRGPVVCRPSTTATIVSPEMIFTNKSFKSETKGFSECLTGYLMTRFNSVSPFARAVSTYGRCNSSRRLARIFRITSAVPAVPRTIVGIQR